MYFSRLFIISSLLFTNVLVAPAAAQQQENIVLLPIEVSPEYANQENLIGVALQQSLSKNFNVFYGDSVEAALQAEYAKEDCSAEACVQNIAILFNGEIVVDASLQLVEKSTFLSVQFRNVITGELEAVVQDSCDDCSFSELVKFIDRRTNNVQLKSSKGLTALLKEAPEPEERAVKRAPVQVPNKDVVLPQQTARQKPPKVASPSYWKWGLGALVLGAAGGGGSSSSSGSGDIPASEDDINVSDGGGAETEITPLTSNFSGNSDIYGQSNFETVISSSLAGGALKGTYAGGAPTGEYPNPSDNGSLVLRTANDDPNQLSYACVHCDTDDPLQLDFSHERSAHASMTNFEQRIKWFLRDPGDGAVLVLADFEQFTGGTIFGMYREYGKIEANYMGIFDQEARDDITSLPQLDASFSGFSTGYIMNGSEYWTTSDVEVNVDPAASTFDFVSSGTITHNELRRFSCCETSSGQYDFSVSGTISSGGQLENPVFVFDGGFFGSDADKAFEGNFFNNDNSTVAGAFSVHQSGTHYIGSFGAER